MQSPPSYHPPTPISMATGQPMYPHAPQHTVINSQTLPHQLRLTFAVRDGVLLKPFQLEHGRSLIQVPFHLKESVHDMLLSRSVSPLFLSLSLFNCYPLLLLGMIWSYSSNAIIMTTSKRCVIGHKAFLLESMDIHSTLTE